MFSSILHPSNLSREDDQAFDHALALAVAFRSALTIFHVGSATQKSDWDRFPAVRKRLIEWGQLPAGAVKTDVAKKLGVEVHKVDASGGDIVDVIHGYGQRHPAELLVMANGSRDGIESLLTPSVSEALARDAQLPSLFVSPDVKGFVDSGQINIDTVLIPVSDDVPWWHALHLTSEFFAALGKELPAIRCLHVGEQFPAPSNRMELNYELITEQGDVVEHIVSHSASNDLVLMVTEGHKHLLDAITGSTTEKVIRNAACPVLSIPAESKS